MADDEIRDEALGLGEIIPSAQGDGDPGVAPCECGCGRVGPEGRIEFIHPEDYRSED